MQADIIDRHYTISHSLLTVVKKSPTHLDIMRAIMIQMPKVMSPVHSTMMTVREMVVRRIPPSWLAAPIRAYLPISLAWSGGGEYSSVNDDR